MLHAARCQYRTQKLRKKLPSAHHRPTLLFRNWGIYRQSEKNFLNRSISFTCPHNMVNFCLVTAEIDWWVWGTPANFNEFRALASLLQRRRSTDVNQTARCSAVSWAGTLYIHFGDSYPVTEFCRMQNSLWVQVLRSPVLAALLRGTGAMCISQTLRHGTVNGITERSLLVIFNRWRHLYPEGDHHVMHRPTLLSFVWFRAAD